MNFQKHLLTIVVTSLPFLSLAQTDTKPATQKPKTVKTKSQMTPQERKKAAVQRTLKEKKFKLPDTTRNR